MKEEALMTFLQILPDISKYTLDFFFQCLIFGDANILCCPQMLVLKMELVSSANNNIMKRRVEY